MSILKKGMLAIIIHDDFIQNLGRVVVIGDFYGPVSDCYGEKYADGWEIEAYHDEPLVVIDGDTGEIDHEREAITSGRYLMPLHGDDSLKAQYATEVVSV